MGDYKKQKEGAGMLKAKDLKGKTYSELILKYDGVSDLAICEAVATLLEIMTEVHKSFRFHEYKIYRTNLRVQTQKIKVDFSVSL